MLRAIPMRARPSIVAAEVLLLIPASAVLADGEFELALTILALGALGLRFPAVVGWIVLALTLLAGLVLFVAAGIAGVTFAEFLPAFALVVGPGLACGLLFLRAARVRRRLRAARRQRLPLDRSVRMAAMSTGTSSRRSVALSRGRARTHGRGEAGPARSSAGRDRCRPR